MGKKTIVYIRKKTSRVLLVFLMAGIMIWMLPQIEIPAFKDSANIFSEQFLALVLMGIALGTDAFSLSIGIGMKKVCAVDIIKTSVVIGIFHIIMPLGGMILGEVFGAVLGIYAFYIGRLLIIFIGANMIYESYKGSEKPCEDKLIGLSLILLAFSVSLDALTIGFGLGAFGFSIPLVIAVFGFFGATMTAIGLSFGRYIGGWIGERSEMIGGTVLVVLGIKMLL
ncbi:manganese efflux pump [Alkalicella caledoniensis]|uniref:Putative manganese efflux pump MntP n=1 Tax=Alkalicella caledoniensis TaxID=2731377 RepID=A0A7G9W8Z4_ALKCA|nr:manganese efflux pump MntP family protein [Alkalicella caledoniensis]QNO15156.1 manganese efflux pump [Alkalicella caledoniensis]